MNKRKLRRVAIVALVLVLLCNTLGVQAETGAPAVTVSSYEELVNAIDQASNLDTILIGAVIWIPEGASLGDSSKTVILKSSGGYMEIVENTQSEEITGDSYNISISAPEEPESQIQPVNEVSTLNAPESTTEPHRSPNWVECVSMILLAVLVGLEIKDRLHRSKE